MGFVDRAKSMHARGDAVRAAVILAQGLKRDPKDVEAVGWLLHLYVEELPNPGLESDLLQVIALQPNGADLLAIVRAELGELALHEKSRALDKTLEHTPLQFVSSPPTDREVASTVAPDRPASLSGSEFVERDPPSAGGENWESFDSPFDESASADPPQQTEPQPRPEREETPRKGDLEPGLARRSLSASIDLALSQPLTAVDHAGSFKHGYLEDPNGGSKRLGFWAVIAGVAIVCGVLILGYSGTVEREADPQASEWETAPVQAAADEPAGGSGVAEGEGQVVNAPQDEEGE